MRLIDADALSQHFAAMQECVSIRDHMYLMGVLSIIDRAPDVDAVPVVHARWEPIDGTGGSIYKLWRCSSCKNGSTVGGETGPDVPYCFCCGAKMDAKEES